MMDVHDYASMENSFQYLIIQPKTDESDVVKIESCYVCTPMVFSDN